MASMKGSRMWKPASSTSLNLPSRSTTKAFCWGTTTAVLTTTTMAKTARTMAMTSPALMESMLSSSVECRSAPLLGVHPQCQPVHTLHQAALPRLERELRGGAHGPVGAAQLGGPLPAGGQVAQQDRLLPHQLGLHRMLAREPAQQRPAQREQPPQGEDGEGEPLHRFGHAERGQR